MNTARAFYLIAAITFASPGYAQECSGGSGGGVDATGNQCSHAATIEAYTTASPPQVTAKMGGIEQSKVTGATVAPTAKMSAAPAKPTAVAKEASRFPKVAAPPAAPVRTAKIEAGDGSPCSGGASGGMDATGNECGGSPVSGDAVITVATKR